MNLDVHYCPDADPNYNAIKVPEGGLAKALQQRVYTSCDRLVRLVQPLSGKMITEGRVPASPEPKDVTCARCLKHMDTYAPRGSQDDQEEPKPDTPLW